VSAPLVTDLVAVCHHEPRGDFGLEGYQRGETYRCQHVKDGDGRPPYYRVYPGEDDYYECASPRSVTKYFTIEEKAS
jgi:hypothetical protein